MTATQKDAHQEEQQRYNGNIEDDNLFIGLTGKYEADKDQSRKRKDRSSFKKKSLASDYCFPEHLDVS